MNRRLQSALLAAIAYASLPSQVGAQDAARWQVPPAVIPIDFTAEQPAPRKALTATGLSWELPIAFAMLRTDVTLAVKLPEVGEASFVMSTKDALVDITPNRVDDGKINISVRSQLGRMSVAALQKNVRNKIDEVLAEPRQEANAEAKRMKPPGLRKYLGSRARGREDNELTELYVERRGIELGRPQLRAALDEILAQRPRWATQTEQAAWAKATSDVLSQEYERLLALLLADEHLQLCGIKLDTNTRNFDNLIVSKFKSLHALVTGGSDSESNLVQTLNREEISGLRRALLIEGVCRFVPQTDKRDSNSQWFNAQRLGSPVTGATELRVVGTLDPANGDRTDWWALVGYQEETMQLDIRGEDKFRSEQYTDSDKRTCLRIIAVKQRPVEYTFQLRKYATAATQPVIIHESPGDSNAKFPY